MAIDENPAVWSVDEWCRMMIVDCHGQKIGKLYEVYVDAETAEPLFALVRGGFLDRRLTFVPLRDVRTGPDDLIVAVTRDEVGSEPEVELDGEELSPVDEEALYLYFHQRYVPVNAPNGHRLARR